MPRPGPASARGNHESAGKRLSGRTRFANRVLRQALVESARGAVFKRDCYLAAQYRRLVKRRGDKKAIVAVAHSILVIAYHVLRDGASYRELGATPSTTSMPSASPATTRSGSPRSATRSPSRNRRPEENPNPISVGSPAATNARSRTLASLPTSG